MTTNTVTTRCHRSAFESDVLDQWDIRRRKGTANQLIVNEDLNQASAQKTYIAVFSITICLTK